MLRTAILLFTAFMIASCGIYVRYVSVGDIVDVPGQKIISIDTLNSGSGEKILYIRYKDTLQTK